MKAHCLLYFSLLLSIFTLSSCTERSLIPSSPADPTITSTSSSALSNASSVIAAPESTPLAGECFVLDGISYVRGWQSLSDTPDGRTFEPCATIQVTTTNPASHGEANFGVSGEKIFCSTDPEDAFSLYCHLDGIMYPFYPSVCTARGRALTAIEQVFADNTAALANALQSSNADALANVMHDPAAATIYRTALANTSLTVQRTIFAIEPSSKSYTLVYTAWLDVDVHKSSLFPEGPQRLLATFQNDPRKNHPSGTLPLSHLAVADVRNSPDPQTDPDQYGWMEVADLVAYRIDMSFDRTEDLPQSLLLRIVVPYAHRRLALQGKAGAAISPELVASSAELLFGLSDFSPRDPHYFDQATGCYTLKNHASVVSGMGHTMDYIDPGLNFQFTFGDKDGFRYVTITHYSDPLQLMITRQLEYKTQKISDPITGELVGRVLSSRQII